MADEKKNMFGGKNPHGLYVPMSEDEQEVLLRLAESQDLVLEIKGWMTIENPRLVLGDLRIGIPFTLRFKGALTEVKYFDLVLRRANGQVLFQQRQAIPPIMVGEGIEIGAQWDIAIDHMHPEFVKSIKPGAVGLTSRRIDRDTRERSDLGNMKLNEVAKRALRHIDEGAAKVRAETQAEAKEASKDD